jgi:hypothetical protein
MGGATISVVETSEPYRIRSIRPAKEFKKLMMVVANVRRGILRRSLKLALERSSSQLSNDMPDHRFRESDSSHIFFREFLYERFLICSLFP